MLRAVFDLRRGQGTIPFHVEGNLRAYWKHARDQRSRDSQSQSQRVGKVVVVEGVEVAHQQASSRAVKINLNGAVPNGDHPENVIPIHVNVVVMNLLSEYSRSDRTGVEVKS